MLDTQEDISIVENESSPIHFETETNLNVESTITIEDNNVSTHTMDTLITVSTCAPFDADTKIQLDSSTSRE